MHFLSEDAGDILKETWQAGKWKDEVDASLAGPMVRQDDKDYFVEEPAPANVVGENGEAHISPVLPTRWFMRQGKVWAKVHRLRPHPENGHFVIDARSDTCDELPLTTFFSSYVALKKDHHYFALPDPDMVIGVFYLLIITLYGLKCSYFQELHARDSGATQN
jgi:hypothetical protein